MMSGTGPSTQREVCKEPTSDQSLITYICPVLCCYEYMKRLILIPRTYNTAD